MRGAAIPLIAGIALTSGTALAQGEEDPAAQLRDCSPTERVERLECLNKASPTIAPQQAQGNIWTMSLTTSSVDYWSSRHHHGMVPANPQCFQFAAAAGAPNWWSQDPWVHDASATPANRTCGKLSSPLPDA